MAKCVVCKAEVSDEQMEARRQELNKNGIFALIVPMCEKCRNSKYYGKTVSIRKSR